MKKTNIKEQIICFFKEQMGIDVDENTDFFIDTGMDGDDAVEFIVTFQDKFNVDMSSFDFHKYFLTEEEITSPNPFLPLMLPFILIYRFFTNSQKNVAKHFKLNHLIKVIEQGKWFDPN